MSGPFRRVVSIGQIWRTWQKDGASGLALPIHSSLFCMEKSSPEHHECSISSREGERSPVSRRPSSVSRRRSAAHLLDEVAKFGVQVQVVGVNTIDDSSQLERAHRNDTRADPDS